MRIKISELDVLRGHMHRFAKELQKYPNNEIKSIIDKIQQAMNITNKRINYMSISTIHSLIYQTKKQTMKLVKKYNDKELKRRWEMMENSSQWWLDLALDYNIN
ncbi:hypothetical protein LCGC14_0838380 [marine sediment metagenome]|uniref:Uncharacterized protein n=1 Tax=marine sediment metagenome TaxID=412755 RepID=A0A0F9RYL4_9ZZZZ